MVTEPTEVQATAETADERFDSSLDVEFLYLDAEVCTRCRGTAAVLRDVLDEVAPVLEAAGVSLRFERTHVRTAAQARAVGLVTSPTIRVNGADIQPSASEADCATCGSMTGQAVDCRVWEYDGGTSTTPQRGLLVHALLRAAVGKEPPQPAGGEVRDLPPNLQRFFDAKDARSRDVDSSEVTESDGGCDCGC